MGVIEFVPNGPFSTRIFLTRPNNLIIRKLKTLNFHEFWQINQKKRQIYKEDLCNLRFKVLELVVASGEQDYGCDFWISCNFLMSRLFSLLQNIKISWKFKFMHWTDPKLPLTESHSLDVLPAYLSPQDDNSGQNFLKLLFLSSLKI